MNNATSPTISFTSLETKCKKAYVCFVAHGYSISSSASSSDKIYGYVSASNCTNTGISNGVYGGCFSYYIYSIDDLSTNASISMYARASRSMTYALAFGFIVYVK